MPSVQQVHHGIQDMLYLKDEFSLVFVPLQTWQFTFTYDAPLRNFTVPVKHLSIFDRDTI